MTRSFLATQECMFDIQAGRNRANHLSPMNTERILVHTVHIRSPHHRAVLCCETRFTSTLKNGHAIQWGYFYKMKADSDQKFSRNRGQLEDTKALGHHRSICWSEISVITKAGELRKTRGARISAAYVINVPVQWVRQICTGDHFSRI
jgi:hypothetical protein